MSEQLFDCCCPSHAGSCAQRTRMGVVALIASGPMVLLGVCCPAGKKDVFDVSLISLDISVV